MYSRLKPNQKGILFASFAAFLWGSLGILLKIASHILETYSLVWIRFLVAFLTLLPFYAYFKPEKLTIFRKAPPLLILAGLMLSLNYLAYMHGVKLTSPSSSQVLGQAGSILLVFFGVVFLKEKFYWQQGVGLILSLGGFYFFYTDQVADMLTKPEVYNLGLFWIGIASTAWATFAASTKILVRHYDPQILNLFVYGLASVLFLPFVDFSALANLTFWQWVFIVSLGLNTVFAYGSLALALKYASSSSVGMVVTLNPILCVFLMKVLTDLKISMIDPEIIHSAGYLGAALVIAGAIVVIKYNVPEQAKFVENSEQISSP